MLQTVTVSLSIKTIAEHRAIKLAFLKISYCVYKKKSTALNFKKITIHLFLRRVNLKIK
tara:strand:- start:52 stop:228 length:177 start_codon:yes stop_codon:yes gene_type:complete